MRDKRKDDAEKAIRRQRAMEAGFRLFSEKGIEAVTMPEVAEASGVGRPSLYRYFSTKLEFVIAIGTWKWEVFLDRYVRTVAPDRRAAMTAAELLRWYMDGYIALYRNHRDILRFNYYFNSYLRNERAGSEQKEPYMRVVAKLREFFHELYERGRTDGTLRCDVSEEVMLSSLFHIMLAAASRYAIGLVYVPEEESETENELIMLEELLLQRFTVPGGGKQGRC